MPRLEKQLRLNIMVNGHPRQEAVLKSQLTTISPTRNKHKYRLGNEWTESSPVEKDLGDDKGGLVDEKLNMSEQCALTAQYPGLHQKKRDQQIKEGDSPHLLHSHETPPGVLRSALGAPT